MRSFLSCRYGRSATRRAAKSHRETGFSILEILVVLGVVGLVVGIGLPSLMQQMSRNRLESAANNVANLMRQTRLRAIRDNTDYTVELGASGDTVEGVGIIDDVTLDFTPSDSKIEIYDDPSPDCSELEADGVAGHYDIVDVIVTFESTGTAEGPGAICVHDNAGNILQVAVDSTTAQPRIRKYLPGANAPGGNAGFYQKTTGSSADPNDWGSPLWVWF
ncbi:MAG: hypothetical protein GY719_27410 [bacterium]|nr:hypothetical protein [bacterium]